MDASTTCLYAVLLTFLTTVLGDLKLMHPVAGGGMVVGDVSYDSPDYHYLAASPLGGVIATDYDNFIPTGSLGFGGLAGGLGVLPPMVPAPAAAVSRFPLRSFSRVSPLRRYGRRVRLFRL